MRDSSQSGELQAFLEGRQAEQNDPIKAHQKLDLLVQLSRNTKEGGVRVHVDEKTQNVWAHYKCFERAEWLGQESPIIETELRTLMREEKLYREALEMLDAAQNLTVIFLNQLKENVAAQDTLQKADSGFKHAARKLFTRSEEKKTLSDQFSDWITQKAQKAAHWPIYHGFKNNDVVNLGLRKEELVSDFLTKQGVESKHISGVSINLSGGLDAWKKNLLGQYKEAHAQIVSWIQDFNQEFSLHIPIPEEPVWPEIKTDSYR